MADLFDGAAEFLRNQLGGYCAREITYSRAANSVAVAATVGETAFNAQDQYGVTFRVVLRDYLIATSGLILNGAAVAPLPGDRIADGDETYEVAAIAGEPCFRESDRGGTLLRIHTKRLA